MAKVCRIIIYLYLLEIGVRNKDFIGCCCAEIYSGNLMNIFFKILKLIMSLNNMSLIIMFTPQDIRREINVMFCE